MKIIPIPLNSDNYGYLLYNEASKVGAIVDVSNQPETVLQVAKSNGIRIETVLSTHKHWDHSGGNEAIKLAIPSIEILGSKIDEVEGCTKYVEDNQLLDIAGIQVRCIHTPGHTLGHICYYATHEGESAVFTGDCLFIGGCGKFFEGSAETFYSGLQKLAALPPSTKVYCGHEYTVNNYKFALSVDANNSNLVAAKTAAESNRANNHPTIPSTIEKELLTNPFLRLANVSSLINASSSLDQCVDCNDPVAVLGYLRAKKDKF